MDNGTTKVLGASDKKDYQTPTFITLYIDYQTPLPMQQRPDVKTGRTENI